MIFELSPKFGARAAMQGSGEKHSKQKGNLCKGPETGIRLVGFRNVKVQVAGTCRVSD